MFIMHKDDIIKLEIIDMLCNKISTIDLFLLNFSPLGCEGIRGSHLTIRLFTSTAAADRPRADMPAPIATPNNV